MRRWLLIALCNIGLLVLFLGIAEVAARIAFPCALSGPELHSSFVPGVGLTNEPNALVRDTNGFDYCVEQRANSLGFLDAEPPPWGSIKDKLRVAIVGDSVVEASGVHVAQKIQTILRADLAASGIDASVTAWGISGYGQVQELAAFKHFALTFRPDVVVIVIVSNDLKNNSWLLQALQDGYAPNTPYSVEIRPVLPEVRTWEILEPVPKDQLGRLPRTTPPQQPGRAEWLTPWLKNHSFLYTYAMFLASWNYPRVLEMLTGGAGGAVPNNPLPEWVRYVSRDPAIVPLLADWPADIYPNDIDSVFERRPLPRAWDLAVGATVYIMDRWVALSQSEGFKLIALIRTELDSYPSQAAVWRRILKEREIPVISQREFLARRGYDPAAEHFLRDGHWSAQGHRWAAESIAEFLLQRRQEYLTPHNVTSLLSR